MQFVNRKSNRLKKFDYSKNGYYFVTICVRNKVKWFGEVGNGEMILNKYGEVVKQQWIWLEKQYEYIELDEYVVMPNHIHGIIIIKKYSNDCRDNPRVVPTRVYIPSRSSLLSKTMCAFKTTSSKLIHQLGAQYFRWQRSYYDHIIRSEESLNAVREYIRDNPRKWKEDRNKIENFASISHLAPSLPQKR